MCLLCDWLHLPDSFTSEACGSFGGSGRHLILIAGCDSVTLCWLGENSLGLALCLMCCWMCCLLFDFLEPRFSVGFIPTYSAVIRSREGIHLSWCHYWTGITNTLRQRFCFIVPICVSLCWKQWCWCSINSRFHGNHVSTYRFVCGV